MKWSDLGWFSIAIFITWTFVALLFSLITGTGMDWRHSFHDTFVGWLGAVYLFWGLRSRYRYIEQQDKPLVQLR